MALDDITGYKGREAAFAAECAMEGMIYAYEEDGTTFSEDDAEAEIEAIWDFVIASCEGEGIQHPKKRDAEKELRLMIKSTWG